MATSLVDRPGAALRVKAREKRKRSNAAGPHRTWKDSMRRAHRRDQIEGDLKAEWGVTLADVLSGNID